MMRISEYSAAAERARVLSRLLELDPTDEEAQQALAELQREGIGAIDPQFILGLTPEEEAALEASAQAGSAPACPEPKPIAEGQDPEEPTRPDLHLDPEAASPPAPGELAAGATEVTAPDPEPVEATPEGTEPGPDRWAAHLLVQADEYTRAGRIEEAMDTLRTAIRLVPHDDFARARLFELAAWTESAAPRRDDETVRVETP
jgi:tetratricopeptide (TPR) repeat protein